MRPTSPPDPANRGIGRLFDDASWQEALSDARVLRRRIVLAEILAAPLAMREEPRDLRSVSGSALAGR